MGRPPVFGVAVSHRGGTIPQVAKAHLPWLSGVHMKSKSSLESLQRELQAMLAKKFPGIDVKAEPTSRWNRPCVTFTSASFDGLLPEERFQRLVAVIPTDFREQNMAGLVWVELAPGETLDEFLKLPRSEDVASREREIYGSLAKAKLFESLSEALGSSPDKRCGGDFRELDRILKARRFSQDALRDAKLLLIRHRAYCDCQVLLTAQSELARLYADAA